jgi:hypothetical protein
MKKLGFLILFLIGLSTLWAQSSWDSLPKFKTIPQEKIYLHFDKPYYVAGDRMWFRAYLVDANTHRADSASRVMYVELISGTDSLVQRIKIPYWKGMFAGSILLNETLPEGTYTVRAYTNWMRNVGEDFFFQQSFHIANSITSQITSSIRYEFIDAQKVIATIRFLMRDTPLENTKFTYTLNLKGKQQRQQVATTTTNGEITIVYNPRQIELHKPTLKVQYDEGMSHYERIFVLPAKDDFDIQFFAEGGRFVSGVGNCIAFKAVAPNGLSVDVSGKVFDKNNKQVAVLTTSYLGMGKFYLFPESGQSYYALVKNASGVEKRVELPVVDTEKNALELTTRNGKVIVGLKGVFKDSLLLIGHSRGSIFYSSLLKKGKPVSFKTTDLRPGIVSFVLLDKNKKPLSERLFFIFPSDKKELEVQSDKNLYGKRDSVNLRFFITKNDVPVEGNFSVSITDANDVRIDSTAATILSGLLLSSDLKGYVENPGAYFNGILTNAAEKIDLLMLTQGWKRFDVGQVLSGKKQNAPYFMEKGQAITGKVTTGLLNRPEKGVMVSMLAPSANLFDMQTTDADGRFAFSGFAAPDSTQFTIQAKRKKGLKNAVEIHIDKDSFPAIQEEIVIPDKPMLLPETQLEAASQKFIYENGMLNFNLQELVVYGHRSVDPEIYADPNYFGSIETYSLQGEPLRRYDNQPLSNLLKMLPGMTSWDENRTLQYSQLAAYALEGEVNEDPGPHFAWNDNIYTYNEVQNVQTNTLESVQVLRSMNPLRRQIDPLDDILIVLNFKKGYTLYSSPKPPTIEHYMPLGYAYQAEFYQPKYDVEQVKNSPVPDLRTTIAWIPELKTDAEGNANCWFYTADRPAAYNITIEGIDNGGSVYYFTGRKQFVEK